MILRLPQVRALADQDLSEWLGSAVAEIAYLAPMLDRATVALAARVAVEAVHSRGSAETLAAQVAAGLLVGELRGRVTEGGDIELERTTAPSADRETSS